MSSIFQTFGELSTALGTRSIELVDPGVPLSNWDDGLGFGPAWRNQPSIRKVVGFIARSLASTPLHVFERVSDNDRVRVREGALADLVGRPSRAAGQTAYRFWESVLIDGLIHDRWCVHIAQREDGWELVRIPASLVKFEGDALGRISEVRITIDGSTSVHDPAGFLIDVGYSELGVNGTSPLRTLQDLLAESREAVEWRRALWKRGARVPLVIERPAGARWDDAARERFSRSWSAFSKGGGSEGGTPVLEDGMQAKTVDAFHPRDVLDLEGRRLTDVEVASAFYIAPELVGAREGTFANIKAFKEMLYGPNLGPYFDAWQQTLNSTLVPLLGEGRALYVEASIESKMRGSFEEQASVLSTSAGAPWMTRNEVRALRNLPHVEGADELVTPLNVTAGGQASPQSGKAGDAVLAKFGDRQARAVLSAKAAGAAEWFDRDRWERELVSDLLAVGLPEKEARQVSAAFNDAALERFDEEVSDEN
jgi:HK97 family phage portal protein